MHGITHRWREEFHRDALEIAKAIDTICHCYKKDKLQQIINHYER